MATYSSRPGAPRRPRAEPTANHQAAQTGSDIRATDRDARNPGPALWLDPAEYGQALLDVELALAGEGSLDELTTRLVHARHAPDVAASSEHRGSTGLFGGVAGMLVVLDAACADGRIRRTPELAALDRAVEDLVADRLTEAADRHLSGLVPAGAEFELVTVHQ